MQAAIPIAGSLLGGYLQGKASKDAAKSSNAMQQQGIDWLKQVYGDSQGNFSPYLGAGQQGLAALMGNKYEQSPGYQYLKDEMVHGIDASAAARGQLYSGGHSLDLGRHLEGLAAQDYNNWWNRQAGLAQMGQNAAAQLGSIGAGTGANISSAYGSMGTNTANGIIGQGNAWTNGLSALGNTISDYYGGKSAFSK